MSRGTVVWLKYLSGRRINKDLNHLPALNAVSPQAPIPGLVEVQWSIGTSIMKSSPWPRSMTSSRAGQVADWRELRHAALADTELMGKILRVCRSHCQNPYTQRYHFWKIYAGKHIA